MKYYHLLWAVALSAGFISYKKFTAYFAGKTAPIFFFILLFIIFTFLIALIFLRKNHRTSDRVLKIVLALSVLVFYISGLLNSGRFHITQNDNLLKSVDDFSKSLTDMEIIASGRISSHVRYYGKSASFYLETENILIKDSKTGIKKTIMWGDELPVRINLDSIGTLIRDDFIRLNCQIKGRQEQYYLYGYGSGLESICPGGAAGSLFELRSKAYNCIRCMLYKSLKSNTAALCEAIILGNTTNIPDRISSDFKKSGIYHLLAISGLHISFFIFIVNTFLNLIIIGKGNRSRFGKSGTFIQLLVILLILFAYNFLVGGKASTIRSTVMSAYFLLAAGSGRELRIKTILSYVFIFLLIINPGFFTEPGFWLTFVAVFAIVYTNKIFKKVFVIIIEELFSRRAAYLNKKSEKKGSYAWDYIISMFVTTFSVNIFIVPILLFVFKEASILSFLTNPFAIPVFFILLFILIISSITALIWPPAGGVIARTAEIFVAWLLKIAGAWRFLSFGTVMVKDFKVIYLIVYYIFLLVMFIIVSRITENLAKNKTHEGKRFLKTKTMHAFHKQKYPDA